MLIVGFAGLAQKLPFLWQESAQPRCRKIGDTGEDVVKPGLWIDVIETTRRDHRQHNRGTVGPTLATSEGPVAPSQGGSSQSAFCAIVGQADPAVVEEASEALPAPEHIVDRLHDLGRAREGFALAQQPGMHVVEKWLALFLAHGASFVGAAAVDGALDLEQRVQPPDRLQYDGGDRFALLAFPR